MRKQGTLKRQIRRGLLANSMRNVEERHLSSLESPRFETSDLTFRKKLYNILRRFTKHFLRTFVKRFHYRHIAVHGLPAQEWRCHESVLLDFFCGEVLGFEILSISLHANRDQRHTFNSVNCFAMKRFTTLLIAAFYAFVGFSEELVQLPEGVEPEVWTLEGYFRTLSQTLYVQYEISVAFDGNDVYIQGLSYYFEDSWIVGNLDPETNRITFPTGQYVGEDGDGPEYLLGGDGYDGTFTVITDIFFQYDPEVPMLELKNIVYENAMPSEVLFYGIWLDVILYAGKPIVTEPVAVPDNLETEAYVITAKVQPIEYNEWNDHICQMQVGFDGRDVYFKGLTYETSDFWAKGTMSSDGETVTIPANQYLGSTTVPAGQNLTYTFDYFITAVDNETGKFADIVFYYDPNNFTFTSKQEIFLNRNKLKLDYERILKDVTITKVVERAAIPADPEVTACNLTGGFNTCVIIKIPPVDTKGIPLFTDKLFYTIWYELDGNVHQFTVLADEYEFVDTDMTEIPYDYYDDYDFYIYGESGEKQLYLYSADTDISSWTKVGVQSIYYGEGERHESNIVWKVNPLIGLPITVGNAKYATYVAPEDADFIGSGLTAYTATCNGRYIQLTPVTSVPAGTAVVVKAKAADTYYAAKTTGAVLNAENALIAATADIVADGSQYILANDELGIGFYQTTPGSTIAAGKGYLVMDTTVKPFYPFGDDDATGIASPLGKMEEKPVIYNLAGQRDLGDVPASY